MRAIFRKGREATVLLRRVTSRVQCGIAVVAAILLSDSALAAPRVVAQLQLNYLESAHVLLDDGGELLANGQYVGSGDGAATGPLGGRIAWDLYEDQTRGDLHPAQFRGYIEKSGDRHSFQIIGVFTPVPGKPIRRWEFIGTIVFDDDALFPARNASVTGYVETGVWRHHYIVWDVTQSWCTGNSDRSAT